MTNICAKLQPLLSEYVDGALLPDDSWAIRNHVAHCSTCGQFLQDIEKTRSLLQLLPQSEPTLGFDAKLANRILEIRPTVNRRRWLGRLGVFLPLDIRRPALTLAPIVAVLIIGAFFYWPRHTHATQGSPPPFSNGTPLVSQCLEQHRNNVTAQPLSDSSAQTLADRLQSTSQAGDPGTESDDDTL